MRRRANRGFKGRAALDGDMYDVVLFPTDGGPEAEAALEHAIDQAAGHGATLDVLLVGDDETGESAVERAAARAESAGVEVNTAVIRGDPHEVIVDYVEDRDVDLVVMATHGRSGLDRLLAGSVTESVVRALAVPVLVVPVGN